MKETIKPSVGLFIETLGVGGTERDVVSLAHGLLDTRFRPRVFVWRRTDYGHETTLDLDRIKLERVTRRFRFDPSPVIKIAGMLRSGELTIAHGFHPRGRLTVSLAGALARREAVASVTHERETDQPSLNRLMSRLAYRLATVVVPNSHAGERDLRDRFPGAARRTEVIHQGVDLEKFRPANNDERRAARTSLGIAPDVTLLLTVGRFNTTKNHRGLVHALNEIPERSRIHAIFVGRDQGERASVIDLISELGLTDVVQIPDPTPRMEPFYRAADVLVHPSMTEAFPNAVLEAMASALPIVAYDTGDLGRLVRSGETGWLVPRGDHQGLVRSISDAIAAPAESLRKMGLRGRDRLVELDLGIDSYVRRCVKLYEEILDGRAQVSS